MRLCTAKLPHIFQADSIVTFSRLILLSLERDVLQRIHDGHLGVTKCLERAKSSVWWPGITKEIKKKVVCHFCQVNRPSQRKEPLKTTQLPERPWQRVAVDALEMDGKNIWL